MVDFISTELYKGEAWIGDFKLASQQMSPSDALASRHLFTACWVMTRYYCALKSCSIGSLYNEMYYLTNGFSCTKYKHWQLCSFESDSLFQNNQPQRKIWPREFVLIGVS